MNNINNFSIEILNEIKKADTKKNKFEIKQIIKQKIRRTVYNDFPLSNINNIKNTSSSYFYNYDYQRYDSKLEYNEFSKKFYLSNFHSKTIFTNSGMASITSLIFSLDKMTKYGIAYSKDIYFESQKIIKHFSRRRINKKILYLDSISINFELKKELFGNYKIIVIDTTCFHSHFFNNIIDEIVNSNKLCILVRSHTKLDMAGLEYSTMGSITYFLPTKISQRKLNLYTNLIKFNVDFIGNSGLNINEHNIFPFLTDHEFIKYNELRINRIRNNNLYFYDKLRSKKYNLTFPNHNLFSLLNLETEVNIDELKKIVIQFSDCNFSLCKYSPSFAFDYISLDVYYDIDFKNYTVRISIGDVKRSVIDEFAEKFRLQLYDQLLNR